MVWHSFLSPIAKAKIPYLASSYFYIWHLQVHITRFLYIFWRISAYKSFMSLSHFSVVAYNFLVLVGFNLKHFQLLNLELFLKSISSSYSRFPRSPQKTKLKCFLLSFKVSPLIIPIIFWAGFILNSYLVILCIVS